MVILPYVGSSPNTSEHKLAKKLPGSSRPSIARARIVCRFTVLVSLGQPSNSAHDPPVRVTRHRHRVRANVFEFSRRGVCPPPESSRPLRQNLQGS